MMEANPMETEMRRESAVWIRDQRADIHADLDRTHAELAKAKARVAALTEDVKMLEAVVAEYERVDRQSATDE